ncbi:hypothetical protein Bpfe_029505, partial [Biomphalaria pfeifferi]
AKETALTESNWPVQNSVWEIHLPNTTKKVMNDGDLLIVYKDDLTQCSSVTTQYT